MVVLLYQKNDSSPKEAEKNGGLGLAKACKSLQGRSFAVKCDASPCRDGSRERVKGLPFSPWSVRVNCRLSTLSSSSSGATGARGEGEGEGR